MQQQVPTEGELSAPAAARAHLRVKRSVSELDLAHTVVSHWRLTQRYFGLKVRRSWRQ